MKVYFLTHPKCTQKLLNEPICAHGNPKNREAWPKYSICPLTYTDETFNSSYDVKTFLCIFYRQKKKMKIHSS